MLWQNYGKAIQIVKKKSLDRGNQILEFSENKFNNSFS